jgi:hypothetical protein
MVIPSASACVAGVFILCVLMSCLVGAQLEVIVKKGLADSHVKEIKQLLAQQVEENMGMAMMYTLCEAMREYLVENNREGNVRCVLIELRSEGEPGRR